MHTLSITGDENQPPTAGGSVSLLDDDYIGNGFHRPAPNSEPSREDSGSQVDEEDLISMGGGVWVEQGRRRQPARGSVRGDGIQYTAFDAQGQPHRRTAAPPSESGMTVHSGWESWGITPSGKFGREIRNPAPAKRNPGFAKIPVSICIF